MAPRLPYPVRVFVAGCLLTALAAAGVHEWIRLSTSRHIDVELVNVEAKINARMAAYLGLLRGAAGFFGSQTWVSREHFRRYFSQVGVIENYPGVQGVGLSLRVPAAEVQDMVATAQREGWPKFKVWPEGPRPEYHTILYLEPEDERNLAAIGYDMHTDPVRRMAMDRARDTGQPAVTGKVILVQEIQAAKQPGFLIYAPFYSGGTRPLTVEARREQLDGFAYAAFRAGDFMKALVDNATLRGVTVQLYDAPRERDDARIFGAAPVRTPSVIVGVRRLRILDRTWTLVGEAEPGGYVSPFAIALIGLIASAGVAVLFRGVERARQRAERSEAVTRAREGELALLVDAVPALVSYISRDGVYQLCNRRCAEWYRMPRDALVGRRVSDLVGPQAYSTIEPFLRRALEGEGVSFERWYHVPGAGARYLGTAYVPHRTEDGAIVGVYALSSDLTAHKRAEEAARFVADCGKLLIASMDYEATTRGIVHLAVPRMADVAVLFRVAGEEIRAVSLAHADGETERRLSAAVDGMRISLSAEHNVAVAARTGMIVVVPAITGPELERSLEDERQRRIIRGLELRSALHVPVVVRGRCWAVLSFGTTTVSGRQFSDKDRQLADEVATRVRLAIENALLYREAQQEIEDRRRAERVAEETEERFRLLVESVRDYAIVTLDTEGRIESWNDGAERILGYNDAEVIGAPRDRLYPPEDRAAGIPAAEVERARTTGAASDERWFTRKDGSRFWASSHLAALLSGADVRGYAWIMRDLTDRKRMEEELERRVQVRTTELNEAVHELEAFSYSVSHDLRAPLRSIRGFTELALEEADGRLSSDERGYLDRVRRAAARLERLIADLLAYTRVSKTKVELRRVDLHALVSDIQREHPEFQPPLADVRIEGHLLSALGNEAYLTQCITNLLGNAVKFVRPGVSASVRIWTERRGDAVRLSVKDNGIGIPPDQLPRVFEIFERLHTDGAYEGTGVGLAIVRRAVQRMQGHVGLESVVGVGSTFWIELQAAD